VTKSTKGEGGDEGESEYNPLSRHGVMAEEQSDAKSNFCLGVTLSQTPKDETKTRRRMGDEGEGGDEGKSEYIPLN
jgi:hypothetical protein